MTKQFTIPCQFGQQTSPVTFYIGHPDNGHHPIHFQSTWLSSAKGGTVPQDLMMTLQKLHDLALENNADFEELCYYALISATQNSGGDGVSESEITSYADEYLKKELNGEIDGEKQNTEVINNTNSSESNNVRRIVNKENNNISNNQQSPTNNIDTDNTVNNNTTNKAKVIPSLNTDAKKTEETKTYNGHNEASNENLLDTDLFDDSSIEEVNNQFETVSQTNNNANEDNNTDDDILMDDDLLFSDDAMFNDDVKTENSIDNNSTNQQTANKNDIDSEYDDLLDDDIIFDNDNDDNNNELLDNFTDINNDNNNTNATTEDEDDLLIDDDLMDFGK